MAQLRLARLSASGIGRQARSASTPGGPSGRRRHAPAGSTAPPGPTRQVPPGAPVRDSGVQAMRAPAHGAVSRALQRQTPAQVPRRLGGRMASAERVPARSGRPARRRTGWDPGRSGRRVRACQVPLVGQSHSSRPSNRAPCQSDSTCQVSWKWLVLRASVPGRSVTTVYRRPSSRNCRRCSFRRVEEDTTARLLVSRTDRHTDAVRAYVAVTDGEWYRFLAAQPAVDEVNFWRPGGGRGLHVLTPGEPFFLLKTHHPHDRVVGAASTAGSRGYASRRRGSCWARTTAYTAWRGCAPGSPRSATSCRARPTTSPQRVWGLFHGLLPGSPGRPRRGRPQRSRGDAPAPLRRPATSPVAAGPTIVPSPVVLDAYDRRCAITGSRIQPVLQAAHVQPLPVGGEHRLDNGLLLRSDIHTLFDLGYLAWTRNTGCWSVPAAGRVRQRRTVLRTVRTADHTARTRRGRPARQFWNGTSTRCTWQPDHPRAQPTVVPVDRGQGWLVVVTGSTSGTVHGHHGRRHGTPRSTPYGPVSSGTFVEHYFGNPWSRERGESPTVRRYDNARQDGAP